LTDAAALALAESRQQHGVDPETPVRISPGSAGDGRYPSYDLRFAALPRPGDVVLVRDGNRLFVAAEAVQPLAGAVLDAEETGGGGHRLVLKGADAE
jgi:Fe-S cluster assembly iron-binding protein IscA